MKCKSGLTFRSGDREVVRNSVMIGLAEDEHGSGLCGVFDSIHLDDDHAAGNSRFQPRSLRLSFRIERCPGRRSVRNGSGM